MVEFLMTGLDEATGRDSRGRFLTDAAGSPSPRAGRRGGQGLGRRSFAAPRANRGTRGKPAPAPAIRLHFLVACGKNGAIRGAISRPVAPGSETILSRASGGA